ncbi:MAG: NfeD family protein [Eubacteriales bacterium]
MSPSSIFWLIVFVVCTVAEACSVGLYFLWFAVGGLVALTSVGFGLSFTLQTVVFLAVSGISMLFLRPIVKNYIKVGEQPTNADRLIGSTAVVTEAIDNITNIGSVQCEGQFWSAKSTVDVVIPIDTKVRVVEIQGVKLLVEMI